MDQHFKLVRRYQYSSEATIFSGRLEFEGIEVYLRDSNLVDTNPIWSNAVGGVKLFVKSDDFEKANQIISEINPFSLDDNDNLIKCSKCGAEEIQMTTSIKDVKTLFAFVFSLLFILMPLHVKHKFRCNKCKFEFD